jgi:CHASE2 domain-containing sensor protein
LRPKGQVDRVSKKNPQSKQSAKKAAKAARQSQPQSQPKAERGGGNDGKETQEGARHTEGSTVLRRALQGIVVAAALIILKTLLVEQSRLGRQIEQGTVNLLQFRLHDAAVGKKERVAVVDIASLLPVRNRRAGEEEKLITPRPALQQVVASVAASNPEAIGIDVFFEPDAYGQLSYDDEQFLDYCLTLKNSATQKKIPVFVGVYRMSRGKDHWLGYQRFGGMGAAIVIPNPENSIAPVGQLITSLDLAVEGETIWADSLSFALSKAVRESDVQGRRLGRVLARHSFGLVEDRTAMQAEKISARAFSIDFGSLDKIMQAKVAAADVPRKRELLEGKIVLIGRGTPGETGDMFSVPDRGAPVPGVYIHAAAVVTLLDSPLYTFSKYGHIVADFLAALFPLLCILALEGNRFRTLYGVAAGIILMVGYLFVDQIGVLVSIALLLLYVYILIFERKRFPKMLYVVMAGLVLVAGDLLVDQTGIYWTDFILVALTLLLHRQLERLSNCVSNFISKRWQRYVYPRQVAQ